MTPIEAVRSALGEPFKSEAKCREVVRAVLLAVREPSEGMIDSGVAFALCVSLGGDYRWSDYVADKHRAMIDALLVEVEKG